MHDVEQVFGLPLLVGICYSAHLSLSGKLWSDYLLEEIQSILVMADIQDDDATDLVEVWRTHPHHHGCAHRAALRSHLLLNHEMWSGGAGL